MSKLPREFYLRSADIVSPELIGKRLVRIFDDGSRFESIISEVEAYCGEDDLACHANKGKTPRTKVMYDVGGKVYVYLIYGMYWLLNVVTHNKGEPHAVLIRGTLDVEGPGRIGKKLKLSKDFYGEDLINSSKIWIEDTNNNFEFVTKPRIGVDYAGEYAEKPWRFILDNSKKQ